MNIYKKMEGINNNILKGNSYKNIKSKYILQHIFGILNKKKLLEIIKCNKNIQNLLNKDINDYKIYNKIIIEIIPINLYIINNTFIKYKKEEEKYFHIYFNDDENKEKK